MHLGEDTFGVASSATCATGCQNQISVARQLLGKAKRLEADLPAVKTDFWALLLPSSFQLLVLQHPTTPCLVGVVRVGT